MAKYYVSEVGKVSVAFTVDAPSGRPYMAAILAELELVRREEFGAYELHSIGEPIRLDPKGRKRLEDAKKRDE